MTEIPSGITTFLFTDIEGSTRLWESQPEAMSAALAHHDTLLHGQIAANGGHVFKTAGDAFCAVFPHPAAAIAAATAAQRALAAAASGLPAPLRVRMAIHAGHAECRDDDFFGPSLNRVARLLATAHGGQVLVSRIAHELARGKVAPEIGLRDLGRYALKDLQEQERIFQVVIPGLPADFPPLRTPERLLQGVPSPATPLIGREAEVRAAREAFGLAPIDEPAAPRSQEAPARLLTLTGPGGAGKTRLALHLAHELGLQFDDGALFVPLAALRDPAHVPAAIVSALDPGDTSGDAPHEVIVAQLRDRRLLLVLDNFEQVMGAAELVADLVRRCPRLSLLVTSRERLNLLGERELPVPPLPLPHPAERSSLATAPVEIDAIEQSPAVRLFVERARAVKPGFALTAENAGAVAEICARLDGLPLAIELAAARARLLTPQALLERFDRRLDLLSRGQRDLPARQQTMRDTIAWSYELLDPAEQGLFRALAVFVDGATIDTALAVAASPDSPDGALENLELIEALADKSLLRIDDGDDPRIAMLETIRDFAGEQLAAGPEAAAIHARHADAFLALAEETEPLLEGRDQARLLARLDREQANLRAAIAWLRGQGRATDALRLSAALWRYWWLRGDMGEGLATLDGLLRASPAASLDVRAKALNGAGVLAESQGDWQEAARLHKESLAISRQIGDLRGVAWSLNNLGVVAINQGRFDEAKALLGESLAVAEQAGDAAFTATALTDLGQIAHLQGNFARATALLDRSLQLFRELGDESHMARALNNLGTAAHEQGDLERARELLTESLRLHRGVGDRQGMASTLNNLAEVFARLEQADTAERLYLESHTLALECANRLYAAIAMENLAALTQRRSDPALARARYQDALCLYRDVADPQGILASLTGIAAIASDEGNGEAAALLLGGVAGICARDGHAPPGFAEAESALRTRFAPAIYEPAWAQGQAMAEEELVAVAVRRGTPPLGDNSGPLTMPARYPR
ncbi:MAG: tetratricopeptide repeat protein [Thermomicrobiales bacterium]|nr:tetratricopeptide repeat protein [Thermomicrobiales bacterium]